MHALDKTIEVAPDFGDKGIQGMCENRAVMTEFEGQLSSAFSAMNQMVQTIGNLPRITTKFNQSKRGLVSALRGLGGSLDSARTQLRAAIALLDKLCDGI